MKKHFIFAALAAIACISFGCSNSEPEVEEKASQNIVASVVDNGSAVKWAKTDAVGVYTDQSDRKSVV